MKVVGLNNTYYAFYFIHRDIFSLSLFLRNWSISDWISCALGILERCWTKLTYPVNFNINPQPTGRRVDAHCTPITRLFLDSVNITHTAGKALGWFVTWFLSSGNCSSRRSGAWCSKSNWLYKLRLWGLSSVPGYSSLRQATTLAVHINPWSSVLTQCFLISK